MIQCIRTFNKIFDIFNFCVFGENLDLQILPGERSGTFGDSNCHRPGCTSVQPQGSWNTYGVSRPDGSALHHATWRSKHRDKEQTHTTHRESEGTQDLLGGTVTDKLDLEAGAAIG